jgi:hypothetical protein
VAKPFTSMSASASASTSSDGHGHGTEGHDRLLIVCFDRLDRLKRSNRRSRSQTFGHKRNSFACL